MMFPRGRAELQIFERRYIDLIRNCLKTNTGFGICLLKTGEETIREDSQQTVHRTGTYANIVDWDQLDNGLLSITAEGQNKFHIDNCWQEESGLLMAEAAFSNSDLVDNEQIPVDDEFAPLTDLLQNLESHPLIEQKKLIIDYDNLWDLGWRLGDLIPIANEQKQQLLEIDDPWDRIESIERLVSEMANEDV
ncbi:MAG: LON peptidase substrate-binding domain-containing protein [Gammaproteobacteria bacterium]|nr:LON peptidase substrate-binding domain-containing protein [Gammaproteobacteria bacterium]MBT4256562.1 LON peptidase substrate-binding domain-containing protein [Gammaproteobacteria bacterium]MBT4582452.1 LON peptidase substrate-binding domain-containing protein [Gammaproteobacteria bacterium]MBT4659185.1 LON peptidase substrate-binding domain-containing protein [Gammaproteobacteria bacterium]MBT4892954.1 LON peptidase substrate-binding domain-containing protein [Gammaproteobacteria bacterium